MRAWNKLSASFVRSVRGEGRYSDGGNLYLQLANGGKSWVFQYQRHGRQRVTQMSEDDRGLLAPNQLVGNDQPIEG